MAVTDGVDGGARSPATAVDLLVSVVAPVRNDAAAVGELLEALDAQTLPRDRFEVLIGDDGSNDGSLDAFAGEDGVRILPGPPLNSYAARNRAARVARGHVLAFCDSDCKPEPEWLEAGLAALEDSELAAGLIHFTLPDRPTVWTLLTVELFCNQEYAVRRRRAAGGNMFVRRELFEELGGFDETLPNGGDHDFALRAVAAGARLRLAPDAVVWHPTRDSARIFFRKAWAVGVSYAIRQIRDGYRPAPLRISSWLPVVPTMWSRRKSGLPLGLNVRRMEALGVRLRLRDKLATLALMYLLIPYVNSAAQLTGWWSTRRATGSL